MFFSLPVFFGGSDASGHRLESGDTRYRSPRASSQRCSFAYYRQSVLQKTQHSAVRSQRPARLAGAAFFRAAAAFFWGTAAGLVFFVFFVVVFFVVLPAVFNATASRIRAFNAVSFTFSFS